MSVSRVQLEISSNEFTEWKAYERIETLDYDGWRQTDLLASLILAFGGETSKPGDFIPVAPAEDSESADDGESSEEVAAKMKLKSYLKRIETKYGDEKDGDSIIGSQDSGAVPGVDV